MIEYKENLQTCSYRIYKYVGLKINKYIKKNEILVIFYELGFKIK